MNLQVEEHIIPLVCSFYHIATLDSINFDVVVGLFSIFRLIYRAFYRLFPHLLIKEFCLPFSSNWHVISTMICLGNWSG
jgi:hypothetical protein